MDKPNTGLDECPRILLSCFRARNSEFDSAYQGDEVSLLHDLRQLLSPVRARLDLVPEQVAGREVREAVLGHDALALGPLPATGPAWNQGWIN